VRINGQLRKVQRAAWEFAHGPLPPGVRVNSCAGERACVRLDHLSLSTGAQSGVVDVAPKPGRRPRGAGSLRELRPGVWKIAIAVNDTVDGGTRRRTLTVRGTRDDAERALADLARPARRDLGDLCVRELVGRYLDELRAEDSVGLEHDRRMLYELIDPALGAQPAASFSPAGVEHAMRAVYLDLGAEPVRHALGLLRAAYRWANQQCWCDTNPADDITVRSLR